MPLNPVDVAIGSRIRNLRLTLNQSSDEFALRVGLGSSDMDGIESGRYRPAAAQLLMIAEALGVPVHHLFEGAVGAEKPAANHVAKVIQFPAKRG